MKDHIIFDIDHVLSNAARRDPLLDGIYSPANGVTWDDYHSDGANDDPMHDVVELLTLFVKAARTAGYNYKVVAITGRPEKWRTMTLEWMVKHDVLVDELLMRPSGDRRKAPEVKLELARTFFGGDDGVREKVLLLFDDDERIVQAFHGLGITTCQVFGRTK